MPSNHLILGHPLLLPPSILHNIRGFSSGADQSQFFVTGAQIIGVSASLVTQMVKHLPTMWETWVQLQCREDPLEKELTTAVLLPGKIPWTEESMFSS